MNDPQVFFKVLQIFASVIAGGLLFLFLSSLAGGFKKRKKEETKEEPPKTDHKVDVRDRLW